MSQDVVPESNIPPNNLKNSQITSTTLLKTNHASKMVSEQDIEQSCLVLSQLQNASKTVILQDASTGKSTTLQLKNIHKVTSSEQNSPQSVQSITSTGCQKPTQISQGRPQIVYITGRNSTTNTLMVRPHLQHLSHLKTAMFKSGNKISISKVITNPSNENTKVIVPKNNVNIDGVVSSNIVSENNSLHFVRTTAPVVNRDQQSILVSTPKLATGNQKSLPNSNVKPFPKVQNSNVGYINLNSHTQNKGSILNFHIADGKINHESPAVSLVNKNEEEGRIPKNDNNMITYNIKKVVLTEKDFKSKSDLIEKHDSLKSRKQFMNSMLSKLASCTIDNKLTERTNCEQKQKIEYVVCESPDKQTDNINNIKEDSEKNREAEGTVITNSNPNSILKSQPRIKKQQLHIKEDVHEDCKEVSNAHKNERKKKINRSYQRRVDYSKLIDPMQNLIWRNNIGTLDKTNLHFKKNEFGLYDLLSELEYDALITGRKDSKYYTPLAKRQEIQDVRKSKSPDDLYKCFTCASWGPAIEFISPEFCSTVCADVYKEQKRELLRREVDKHDSRADSRSEDDESDSDEDNARNTLYPWMHSKNGFSWSKYMSYKKTKPAPIRLFKEPFPYQKNGFRKGMKLEAIDPHHESFICVVSVVDVKGYRVRLHFDSYPRKYDFWVNADSLDIFPVGWCEKNNRSLQPPKYITPESFNWTSYLRQCKAMAAPKNLFPHASNETGCPHGFRVGMKLEALDRKNSNKVSVATVADVLFPQRFLIHFDGWDEMYDYWVDATSPYIHPIGWCEEHNETLIPPSEYNDERPFTWDEYLKTTNSVAAPARAFKRRMVSGFRVGMKIEAVDARVPFLIRVATVADVEDYSLKISFDGWPPRYSYWVDDESPDIHPVGWCLKTGHNLEPPLMPEDVQSSASLGCGIPGCTGFGNVMDPEQSRHTKTKACPYALSNLDARIETRFDRLHHSDTEEFPVNASPVSKISLKRASSDSFCENPIKRERSLSESSSNENEVNLEDSCDISIKSESCDDISSLENHQQNSPYQINELTTFKKELKKCLKSIIFKPGFLPNPPKCIDRELWLKYTQPLDPLVKKPFKDPRLWTCSEVVKFVSDIPNCSDHAYVFEEQDIDGECFVMLTQHDLIAYCDLRIGPAVKIYNSIMLLRELINS